MNQPVFVAGYPKSGTTWLTRFLGHLYNSPTGGSTPQEDGKEIATEGSGRSGKFFFRKGHYIIQNRAGKRPAFPVMEPHVFDFRSLDFYPIIMIVRDPRDICVSGASHWNVPQETFFTWMDQGIGGLRLVGEWDKYINQWLMVIDLFPQKSILGFEDMVSGKVNHISDSLTSLGLPLKTHEEIGESLDFHSIENTRKRIQKANPKKLIRGMNFQMKFLRRGISGSWRDEMDEKLVKKIEARFSLTMAALGYEREFLS